MGSPVRLQIVNCMSILDDENQLRWTFVLLGISFLWILYGSLKLVFPVFPFQAKRGEEPQTAGALVRVIRYIPILVARRMFYC